MVASSHCEACQCLACRVVVTTAQMALAGRPACHAKHENILKERVIRRELAGDIFNTILTIPSHKSHIQCL